MNKKSCYGCRALAERFDGFRMKYYACNLGYKIREDEIRHDWGKSTLPIPLESCPKPRTWREYSICPTKHAPDVVESVASSDILPASEVSASEADSTPATTQVM